jgi:hypothetical protein
MERDSMVIYKSFYSAIKDLDNDTRVQIYDAIYEYGLYLNEPKTFDGICKVVWTLIKPQLDANIKKYKNGKKGAKHGSKGGRPKKPHTVNNKNPLGVNNKNPTRLKTKTPNVNDNVNVNVNVNDNENIDKNIFSFENLTNKHNQIKRDFQIDSFPKLRRDKELNKSFLTWLIYRKANSLFEVEAHLKSFIKLVKDRYTTESIILAVDHAILNKHLSIHPTEKLKTSGYKFPSKGPIPPGT